MKKNAFTLIELLAVIVILAIIALIATPIVLNIIKDSKESSQLRSTEFYINGVEQVITKKLLNDTSFKVRECEIDEDGNLKCDGKTEVEVEISGEKPSSGKVCLSSKGIVDKVMVKYSNYYVSYDGKETKISDKNTFDSFSCRESIFNGEVEFVFNSNIGFYLSDTCIDYSKMEIPAIYTITVDGTKEYEVVTLYSEPTSESLGSKEFYMMNRNGQLGFAHMPDDGMCMFISKDATLEGKHQIKIEKSSTELIPHTVIVNPDSTGVSLEIMSTELKNSSYEIEIRDHNNQVLLQDVRETNGDDGFCIGYCLGSFVRGYYSKIGISIDEYMKDGKYITVIIKQDGKELKFGGSPFTYVEKTMNSLGCEREDYYYWGSELIDDSGC